MSNLSQDWEDFIASLRKDDKNYGDPNSLHSLLKASRLLQENDQYLMIALSSEVEVSRARKKFAKIQKKMPLKWQSPKRLKFCLFPKNPLQSLNHEPLDYEVGRPNLALVACINTEKNCQDLYDDLNKRTEMLAGGSSIEVEFASSVRVGGPRGFLDTLLPVFHPVYGVPYIPASTLKGIVRAWARDNPQVVSVTEMERVLGFIDRKSDPKTGEKYKTPRSSLGTVQFFDAFPIEPCLSLDVVTPNWSWDDAQVVKYKAEPHEFLVMDKPKLKIGVAATNIGNEDDIELAELWLEEALSCGLGSRTSAGYGRVRGRHQTLTGQLNSVFKFEMKTQGIYGSDPPTKDNNYQGTPEFRATVVRGILRYWFRAIALGIYSPEWCKRLEEDLFGTIEPVLRLDLPTEKRNKPIEGSIRLSVELTRSANVSPFEYKGKIYLESKKEEHHKVVENLLILASHVSGIGRGSRRPLHLNSGRWRGCFWQLEEHRYPPDRLQKLVTDTIGLVRDLNRNRANNTPMAADLGGPNTRKQDVLNSSARMFVVPQEGLTEISRGLAMQLLYNEKYKGGVPGRSGNPYVAGTAGSDGSTPSYVTVQTNMPSSGTPYETVIVFGAASDEVPRSGGIYGSRSRFCADILRLEGVRELSL